MKIPKQFEFYYGRTPKFVTILDEFEHHYTGTKMYHIRIEYVNYMGRPIAEYETVEERILALYLNEQVKE